MGFSAAIILGALGLVAHQTPPPARPARDVVVRPAAPTGTGVIRGRIIAADSGNPIRRASVTLAQAPPPIQLGAPAGAAPAVRPAPAPGTPNPFTPRQATADADGVFEFTGVAAGSYRILANPGQYSAQYVGMAYGAKRPNGPFASDPGQTIQIGDGQTFDKAVIALPRGAVITGRVMDEAGDPLARVQVYAIVIPPGSTRGMRTGSGAQTDDLGQYRLYGLQSGEFVVAAEARGNTFVPPNAPPEADGDRVGFMTTYYPGTTDEAGAQRVQARAGSETAGVEIRLGLGHLFRVTGTVTDSQGRPVARGNGQLIRRGMAIIGSQNFFFMTDEQGAFQMRNIPAGDYRLTMQYPNANFGSGGTQTDPELANLPLTIAGADVENVAVTLRHGTTITGQVVFEQEPPASVVRQVRVMVSAGNPEEQMGGGLPAPPPATVAADLTFTVKGLMGERLLRAFAPNQYIKSITAGGEDITDTPHEFKPSDRIVITLTSRASTVEGRVTDARGTASAGSGVVMFSEEKALWRTNATWTKRTAVDANGNFRINGLMPGRYFIAAIPRERLSFPPGTADQAFFEQLSKDAASVVVGENEQSRIDLKVVEGSDR